MAQKRLKSMIFPGLSDTYTVPQALSDLTDYSDFTDAQQDITDLQTGLTAAEESVTTYVVGNTNTTGVQLDPGTYVWVKNHSVLTDGLYTVGSTAIVQGGSVVDTNMNAVSEGGLNSLKNSFVTSGSQTYAPTFPTGVSEFDNGCRYWVQGNIVMLKFSFKITNATAGTGTGAFQSNIPSAYRPKSSLTGICENGASTGYSKYAFDSGGKFTIYPQGTGTTYAYGFVTYLI